MPGRAGKVKQLGRVPDLSAWSRIPRPALGGGDWSVSGNKETNRNAVAVAVILLNRLQVVSATPPCKGASSPCTIINQAREETESLVGLCGI
ncbi:UNVERIFIED_CONTAM: hypothetical protein K2H54_018898 [Gekko kuhli]